MKNTELRAVLATVVVVLSVVAPTVTAPAGASNANSSDLNTDYAIQSDVTVTQGKTAEIRLTLPEGANGTLRIGSERLNFVFTAFVQDGDDDGEVTVQFDTVLAGTVKKSVSVADSDDRIVGQLNDPITAPWYSIWMVDAGEYPVSLRESGREVDTSRLHVTAASCPDGTRTSGYTVPSVNMLANGTAEIPVTVPENDDATLRVLTPKTIDLLAANLADGNGDGRVVVRFVTNETGAPKLTAADESDEVTVVDTGSIGTESDAPSAYGLELWSGSNTSVACDSADKSRISVHQLGRYALPTRLSVETGQTVEIPLTLPANRTVSLRIGRPDADYRLTLDATDGDGDGRVVVRLDTSEANAESSMVSAASDLDQVSVQSKSVRIRGPPLPPSTYELALRTQLTNYPDRKVGNASLALTGESESSNETASATSGTDESSSSGVPGFGVHLAVVALALLTLKVRRDRRQGQ